MTEYTSKQLQNLFLKQSCEDAWREFRHQIQSNRAIIWDYVVLTASNEEQAAIYRREIDYRLEREGLPSRTKYLVLSDPEGKRVGSGGATLNVLKAIAQNEQKDDTNFFRGLRILVIHSGGDSKRIPQYSVGGKLFSPVPRVLPDGRASFLFDEFMIGTSMIPGRLQEGMLVMSGDTLLLFNALQIDTGFRGAAAISIKEDVETGKNHGVFLGDDTDHVSRFLHKQSVETLTKAGAVNQNRQVDIDTGAILIDRHMLKALYSLISTDNRVDEEKFHRFVNEKARISFYGDFLYPLASESTLESYQKEKPEGDFCQELADCRNRIWEVLKEYRLKLLRLSPAEFIHFGTTGELRVLVANTVEDYGFLGWQHVVSSRKSCQSARHSGLSDAVSETKEISYALHNAYLEDDVTVGDGCYVENSYLTKGTVIGKGSIVSGLRLSEGTEIGEDVVFHGVKLKNQKFVVRVYGVFDNPKGTLEDGGSFLSGTLKGFAEKQEELENLLWNDRDHSLWDALLYPVCDTVDMAVEFGTMLADLAAGRPYDKELFEAWKKADRTSLHDSFNEADGTAIIPWREKLEHRIRVSNFLEQMMRQVGVDSALEIFCGNMRKSEQTLLREMAAKGTFSEKLRIYYGLSRAAVKKQGDFRRGDDENDIQVCFQTIQDEILDSVKQKLKKEQEHHVEKESVNVELPVRVNWGGGWTDTPPYCNEHGGVVLNAAISLKGKNPIRVSIRKLPELVVELESQDIGAHEIFEDMSEVNTCSDPYDKFALHKAALIACGVIRLGDARDLKQVLAQFGGGIYLSTQVIGVPKGSGLGTSSILSGACVKGLYEFFGEDVSDSALYDIVLCMEQLMSTGGGWQDQVGGITPGVKLITTRPGIEQKITVRQLDISQETLEELQERFALIYTGQRRLARNLLRDVVGGYIGNRRESIEALDEMKRVAALMTFELEQGDIDAFAKLLNQHWKLSVQLDAGSTNTCIDQIFLSIEDLIDGKFISGAGGGGFLQVVLKKGVTKQQLQKRLYSVFQDSGVDVWECAFV